MHPLRLPLLNSNVRAASLLWVSGSHLCGAPGRAAPLEPCSHLLWEPLSFCLQL